MGHSSPMGSWASSRKKILGHETFKVPQKKIIRLAQNFQSSSKKSNKYNLGIASTIQESIFLYLLKKKLAQITHDFIP
jgi:hypothetical protein